MRYERRAHGIEIATKVLKCACCHSSIFSDSHAFFACRWRKAVPHDVNGLICIFTCRLKSARFLPSLLSTDMWDLRKAAFTRS